MSDAKISKSADVKNFRDMLDAETDRGCALLAAAYLDSQLDELIRSVLVDDPSAVEDLLGQSRPLASFSARIDLAYLLGIISKTVRRDLHLIRKIRNEFGHKAIKLSFDQPAFDARCRQLSHVSLEAGESSRRLFTNAATLILAFVHVPLEESKHAAVKEDFEMSPEIRKMVRGE